MKQPSLGSLSKKNYFDYAGNKEAFSTFIIIKVPYVDKYFVADVTGFVDLRK